MCTFVALHVTVYHNIYLYIKYMELPVYSTSVHDGEEQMVQKGSEV